MLRAAVVASVLLGCSYWPAYADCAVEPWSIPYLGSNTSTTMLAGSGQTNVMTSVTIAFRTQWFGISGGRCRAVPIATWVYGAGQLYVYTFR